MWRLSDYNLHVEVSGLTIRSDDYDGGLFIKCILGTSGFMDKIAYNLYCCSAIETEATS